jgi:hypothetical protein
LKLSELPEIREAFLKKKIEHNASIIDQIDRRVAREQADQNNTKRIQREEDFRRKVEKRIEDTEQRRINKLRRAGANV